MMFEYKPIHWYSGLYLQPQHFQSQQLHDRYWQARYHLLTHPWAWGVINASFNQAALRDEELRLHQGSFVFPDGVYVDCDVNAVVTPRSLRNAWLEREKPLRIYLGLGQVSTSQNNVTCVARAEEGKEHATRWIAWPSGHPMADLCGKGPEVEVQQITYNLRFFFQDEAEQATGYTLLPIGQLRNGADGIEWDSSYLPPCMTLAGVPLMWQRIEQLCLVLTGRLHQFEELKRPQSLEADGLVKEKGILLLVIRTLARHVNRLLHFLEAREVHPWHVVGVLRELTGELSCFTDRCSFNGVWQQDSASAPAYHHADIAVTLDQYERTVTKLLNGLVLEPDMVIPLVKQTSGYLEAEFSIITKEYSRVYLALRSERFIHQEYDIPDDRLIKIAAETQIDTIISRSLAGVRIYYQEIAPQGLPQRMNTRYFRIEERGQVWELIKESGHIAFYWPDAPEDLQANLILARS